MSEPDEENKPSVIEAEVVEAGEDLATTEPEERDLLKLALRTVKSANTKRTYGGHWRRFAQHNDMRPEPFMRWFLTRPKIEAIDLVHEFREHLEDEGKSVSTVAGHLRAIVSIVDKIHRGEACAWTLKGLIETPSPSKYADVTGVSEDAVKEMFAVTKSRGTPDGLRDHAILRLLHDSALRRREVADLGLHHWRPDRRQILVWPKGKARGLREPQFVSKAGAAAIEAWLDARGREPGPLFFQLPVEDPPTPITVESVRWVVKKASQDAGITEPVSPHRLRHAGITFFARRAKDADLVRRFARHAKFDTTLIYIHNVDESVRDMMDAYLEDED